MKAKPGGSAPLLQLTDLPAAVVQHRLGPPVLRPAGNIVADRNRALLAERDGPDALRRHAVAGEKIAHRGRAPRAQRDVVLACAALVRVALDGDRVLRVLLQ